MLVREVPSWVLTDGCWRQITLTDSDTAVAGLCSFGIYTYHKNFLRIGFEI